MKAYVQDHLFSLMTITPPQMCGTTRVVVATRDRCVEFMSCEGGEMRSVSVNFKEMPPTTEIVTVDAFVRDSDGSLVLGLTLVNVCIVCVCVPCVRVRACVCGVCVCARASVCVCMRVRAH